MQFSDAAYIVFIINADIYVFVLFITVYEWWQLKFFTTLCLPTVFMSLNKIGSYFSFHKIKVGLKETCSSKK